MADLEARARSKIERQPNTEYVLSLSYGKDSLACLGAIERLGWPLDRIVHAEVWATDTIPADLPPMVEFKRSADIIIKERYGIEVEHVCAERERERETYESKFYQVHTGGKLNGHIYGFPTTNKPWCNSRLKMAAIRRAQKITKNNASSIVWYLGIASDEHDRLKRLDCITKVSPLDAIGWTETDARLWCEGNGLLSPVYLTSARGGCWFCHNQSVDQLRFLRKSYPDLWRLLMKWDKDSPFSFKPDGHTVHDYDHRFFYEDMGLVPCNRKFRWKMIDELDKTA